MADTKALMKLKVIELKERLTALGKSPKGLKAELVKQLQDAIAEQNLGDNVGHESQQLLHSQEYQTSTDSESFVNEPNFNPIPDNNILSNALQTGESSGPHYYQQSVNQYPQQVYDSAPNYMQTPYEPQFQYNTHPVFSPSQEQFSPNSNQYRIAAQLSPQQLPPQQLAAQALPPQQLTPPIPPQLAARLSPQLSPNIAPQLSPQMAQQYRQPEFHSPHRAFQSNEPNVYPPEYTGQSVAEQMYGMSHLNIPSIPQTQQMVHRSPVVESHLDLTQTQALQHNVNTDMSAYKPVINTTESLKPESFIPCVPTQPHIVTTEAAQEILNFDDVSLGVDPNTESQFSESIDEAFVTEPNQAGYQIPVPSEPFHRDLNQTQLESVASQPTNQIIEEPPALQSQDSTTDETDSNATDQSDNIAEEESEKVSQVFSQTPILPNLQNEQRLETINDTKIIEELNHSEEETSGESNDSNQTDVESNKEQEESVDNEIIESVNENTFIQNEIKPEIKIFNNESETIDSDKQIIESNSEIDSEQIQKQDFNESINESNTEKDSEQIEILKQDSKEYTNESNSEKDCEQIQFLKQDSNEYINETDTEKDSERIEILKQDSKEYMNESKSEKDSEQIQKQDSNESINESNFEKDSEQKQSLKQNSIEYINETNTEKDSEQIHIVKQDSNEYINESNPSPVLEESLESDQLNDSQTETQVTDVTIAPVVDQPIEPRVSVQDENKDPDNGINLIEDKINELRNEAINELKDNKKMTKNQKRKQRKKNRANRKKLEEQIQKQNNDDEDRMDIDEEDDEEDVEIEYVPEQVKKDPIYFQYLRVFDKFRTGEIDKRDLDSQEEEIIDPVKKMLERKKPVELELRDDDDNKDGEPKLSKRKLKQMTRMTVADLKQRVSHPELVEMHDVTARDPLILLHLKSTRNSVPVPRHWCYKRKYLQGKRGFEKPPFKLPEFIRKTGIMEMRQALQEKEDTKSLKAKMREKIRPKMGKIDIDYQKLHDAFFKWQTKPKMTIHGDLYYEGKEFETRLKEKKPGELSNDLRTALGMPTGPNSNKCPPPWLIAMQRYGPPPSYPNIKIPGLNAPIPEGCSFGYHAGGWGKPPVDEYGRPLYGDVFGVTTSIDQNHVEEEVDRTVWGELESESEEEEEEEEEDDDEETDPTAAGKAATAKDLDETGFVTPAEGLVTPSGLTSVPTGMETPDMIELRKRKQIEAEMESGDNPALFTVIPEKKGDKIGREMIGSAHTYDMSAATLRKGQGIDVALDPSELEAGALDTASVAARYEQTMKEQTSHEDLSDMVREHFSQQKRKKHNKESSKSSKKYQQFKF